MGGEGEGVVLLIERLNDLKRRKKKKKEIKRVEIKLLARVFLSLMLLYLRSWSLFFLERKRKRLEEKRRIKYLISTR